MSASWVDTARLARRIPARRATAASGAVRFVELDRALVRVSIAGTGPVTVVFAPDPPTVIEHFAALVDVLSQRCRVVCFEIPGFGFSLPKRGYRFTLEDGAAAVAELLDRLEKGPYVLAMSCVAGLLALEVAQRRPELVSHIVTIQTPSFEEEVRWARRVDPGGLIAVPYLGQAIVALARRKMTSPWFRAALGDAAAAGAFTAKSLEAFDDGADYCLASAFQALRSERAPAYALSQPALCLWGTADRTHRRTDRQSVLRYFRAPQIEEWPDAGHFPELERPERFSERLASFVGLDIKNAAGGNFSQR